MEIIEDEPIIKFIKLVAYSVGKNMHDVADIIGCDYKSISRKNHRKQIKDLDVVKICKQCGYHIYIEKPDIKIDITDFFDKEVNADE